MRGVLLENRYRIDRPVARGGMSTVYRGIDERLDRAVAIKVMSPHYAADPTFLARFEREARAAAMLDNPHVVGVYDQGRDGDHVFLVMELVDGGTLRDLLRERSELSVPMALSIIEPVLEALTAAHAAGLIHRDVKPENILISPKGEIKVADFGLVRAVSSTTLATGDVILGTVAYLSPEQVETGASDERSDVYSAGIVAYEMLAGHAPFGGDNALSVAYQHVHSDVPPVADAAPGVPQAIASVIDAATSRDALARPVNAADFLRRLRDARIALGLRTVPVPVPRPPAPSHSTGSTAGRTTPAGPSPRGTARAGRPDRLTARQAQRSRQQGRSTAKRRTRRPVRWRGRLIALAIVILVAAGAAFGGWWLTNRWTSTPPVVHHSSADAAEQVRRAGLVPVMVTSHDNAVPSGDIVTVVPSPDTRQRKGATVSLVVSAGKPVVPDIPVGASVTDASALIEAADLKPATSDDADVYDNVVPEGAIVRTDPPAGSSQPIGTTVTMIRSLGPVPETVPPVAGKLVEDAENKLLVAGFVIGPPTSRFDPDVDAGTVLGTVPASGKTAPHGSEVSLVLAVSKTVPTISAQTVEAAAAELRSAGFEVVIAEPIFNPAVAAGDLIRFSPPAGTRIDPDNPVVTLTGSNAVTIPHVRGQQVSTARSTLEGLGLTVRVASFFGGESGLVTSQQPTAGTLVRPGSEVRLRAWP